MVIRVAGFITPDVWFPIFHDHSFSQKIGNLEGKKFRACFPAATLYLYILLNPLLSPPDPDILISRGIGMPLVWHSATVNPE